MAAKVQTLMILEPKQFEDLKRLAEITRIPRAALVREAIDDLLKKHARTLRKGGK